MRPTFALMLMLTFLLTGCGSKAPLPLPLPSPSPSETSSPQAPVLEEPAAAPVPVEPAPDGELQRIEIKPGQPVDRVGLFIMKVATGAIEGWVLNPDQMFFPGSISDDNRWVSVRVKAGEALADRTTGKIHRHETGTLVAARGDVLLFQEGAQFAVTRDAMASFQPVALKPGANQMPAAAIAPDGKAVVLVNDSRIYLIEPDSGKYREIGQVAAPDHPGVPWATMSATADGVTIMAQFSPPATRRLRFTWAGKLAEERWVPHTAWFSPDGKWVAWHDSIAGLAHTLVLATASDLKPRLRVIGEATGGLPFQGPYWLPDSSGLMLRTSRGQRLLRLDGSLTEPLSPKKDDGMGLPVPAPDRAGVYAVAGTTVIDGSGKVLAEAVPHSEGKWVGVSGLAPWGDRSDELRFETHTGGKGVSWDPMSFAPSVELAPFPDYDGSLIARVGAGDCVNLRQDFMKEARSVACVPDGTRLTKATPPGRIGKDGITEVSNPIGGGMSLDWWYYVQTDDGQRGWVFLSGDYLAFGEARPGGPAATRLSDDLATMRFWLGVTAGEIECGPSCVSSTTPMQSFGSLMDWCKQELPRLQATPGFDPAAGGAVAFVQTCAAMQSLAPDVGRTDRDPAFVAKARELLAGLPH